MMKDFSLGAILSVVQHRMISPAGSGEVYQLILHVLVGPDASPGVYQLDETSLCACAEELRRQIPWIERVPRRPGADFRNASVHDWAWLDAQERRLGAVHGVRAMANPSTE